jgi:hypothetical protein
MNNAIDIKVYFKSVEARRAFRDSLGIAAYAALNGRFAPKDGESRSARAGHQFRVYSELAATDLVAHIKQFDWAYMSHTPGVVL